MKFIPIMFNANGTKQQSDLNFRKRNKFKGLTALVDRLCLSVGWENGPERSLKTVSFNL